MKNQEEANMSIVGHSVGNVLGSALSRIDDISLPEEERDMERHKQEAIERLETVINLEKEKRGYVPDESMLNFMEALRASDWSTKEALFAFTDAVYNPFTKAEEREKRRDSLKEIFERNRLR